MGKATRARPLRLAEKLGGCAQRFGSDARGADSRLDCPGIPLYRASISQYESGKIEPPLPVLLRYAKIANVYVEVLIDDAIELPAQIPAPRKKIPI